MERLGERGSSDVDAEDTGEGEAGLGVVGVCGVGARKMAWTLEAGGRQRKGNGIECQSVGFCGVRASSEYFQMSQRNEILDLSMCSCTGRGRKHPCVTNTFC